MIIRAVAMERIECGEAVELTIDAKGNAVVNRATPKDEGQMGIDFANGIPPNEGVMDEAAMRAALVERGATVRHKKRGGEYMVLGVGKVQTGEPLTDLTNVVIYQKKDTTELWVRPLAEFRDGRFELVKVANRGVSSEELREIDPIHPDFPAAVAAVEPVSFNYPDPRAEFAAMLRATLSTIDLHDGEPVLHTFDRAVEKVLASTPSWPDASADMHSLTVDVARFHAATDTPQLAKPRFVPERAQLRIDLINEEAKETTSAMASGDLPQIADGLADLIYVSIGAALEFGIPLGAVWAEVQRSNMAKVDPSTGKVRKRADGKVLKPEGWTPPDIERIIIEAMA